jgi:hypothetical protein
MRKKLKSSPDGGDFGSKKCKTRLWWRIWLGLAELAFGGSLESGGLFCVGAFGKESSFSRREDVFTVNFLLNEML